MTYTATALSHTLELQGARQWYDLPTSAGPGGGLFSRLLAAPPGLPPALYTDVWSGPTTVDLTAVDERPEQPELNEFDVVVETSVLVDAGRFGPRGMEDDPSLLDQHGLDVPAGWLRLRIGARGRGTAYDEAVTAAIEHYTVQVWCEAPSPTHDLTTGERIEPRGYVAEAPADSGVSVSPSANDPGASPR